VCQPENLLMLFSLLIHWAKKKHFQHSNLTVLYLVNILLYLLFYYNLKTPLYLNI